MFDEKKSFTFAVTFSAKKFRITCCVFREKIRRKNFTLLLIDPPGIVELDVVHVENGVVQLAVEPAAVFVLRDPLVADSLYVVPLVDVGPHVATPHVAVHAVVVVVPPVEDY